MRFVHFLSELSTSIHTSAHAMDKTVSTRRRSATKPELSEVEIVCVAQVSGKFIRDQRLFTVFAIGMYGQQSRN
jgi:hypothetical protein